MPRGRPSKSSAEQAFERQWEDLRLPNSKSTIQTPASFAIDLRYAQLRVWERWDYERFIRLAKFLNVTLTELASIACINHDQIPQLERRNRLYRGPRKDHSGALVLTWLESHCCSAYTKDVVESPFPDLASVSSSKSSATG